MLQVKECSMVVLAGGKSSRMGSDKADLLLSGKTFLERQVEKGRILGIEDILVSGYRGENASAPIVYDEVADLGPLGGLETAFRQVKHAFVLVLSVDTPLVPLSVLTELMNRYEKKRNKPLIVKAGEREQSLIGIYPAFLADEMVIEITERKGSVFALLRRVGYDVLEVSVEAGLLSNINDPQTYQHLLNNY